LSYPLSVCCLAVVLLLGLLYFVVPRLGELLSSTSTSGSLPWIVKASSFLHGHILSVLVLPLLALLVFYILSRINTSFRNNIASLLLRLPIVSRVSLLYQNSQWLYRLGVSLQCGSTLAECLCSKNTSVTTNTDTGKNISAYAQRLGIIQQGVAAGGTLHDSISNAGLFSPRDLSLIAIAEKTTSLDTMLLQLSQLLQLEFEELIARYLSLLQPLMLLLLSVVVATMVAAIYLPLLQQGGRL
jgi:type II secretory pathway component PulF